MLGGMQDWELRVPRLIDHAEREHGRRELVTPGRTATSLAPTGPGSPATRASWPRRSSGSASSAATASPPWR